MPSVRKVTTSGKRSASTINDAALLIEDKQFVTK